MGRRPLLITVAGAALLIAACSAVQPTATFVPFVPSPTPAATPVPTLAATPTPAPSPTVAAPTQAPLGFTPGTKDSPRKVDIVGDDQLTFWPNVVVVAEGETVTFNVKATGKAVHEFMVGPEADTFADKEGTPEVADIMPGTSKSLTVTFDGPGPYAFACHAPGHFEAGMQGYIVVVGPDVPKAGTTDDPRLVVMSMDDSLKFMPDKVAVTKGETVRFLLTNAGKVVHEFAVGPKDKVDADEVDGTIVKEADEILGHHLKVIDYTFDASGPYSYACHEPGHFQAGMFGDIVLTS